MSCRSYVGKLALDPLLVATWLGEGVELLRASLVIGGHVSPSSSCHKSQTETATSRLDGHK